MREVEEYLRRIRDDLKVTPARGREICEELRSHLEAEVARRCAAGEPQKDAVEAATQGLGEPEALAQQLTKANYRHRTGGSDMIKRIIVWTGVALLIAAAYAWTHPAPYRDWTPRLPLHKAVFAGDKETVARLLAHGAKVDAEDEDITALSIAVCRGNLEMTKLLLDHGADLNRTEKKTNWTPLDFAMFHREAKVADFLVARGARVDGPSGKPPDWRFSNAVRWGQPRMVEVLLAHGADANARDDLGRTPLVLATWIGDKAEVVKALLAAGAKADTADVRGRTALHYASEHGDEEEVRALLDAGADANVRDKDGVTPLMIAGGLLVSPFFHPAKPPRQDVASLLIAAGAEVNARSKDGWTPLIKASVRRDANRVRILLAAGAKVNAVGPGGRTALDYAKGRRAPEAVKVLLAAGGKVGPGASG